MSASKKLRSNLDVIEDLLLNHGFTMDTRAVERRGKRPMIGVLIESRDLDVSAEREGSTFSVALDRALLGLQESYEREFGRVDEGDADALEIIIFEAI